MTASDLYALSNSSKNEGDRRCHWCSSECSRHWINPEPPPPPFTPRQHWLTKVPSSPYICNGCRLWRRGNLQINYMSSGFKMKQTPAAHSWLLTETEAVAIRKEDSHALFAFLLRPVSRFALLLLAHDTANHLQLAVANDFKAFTGTTELAFTVDNKLLKYTIYELEEAIRQQEPTGKEPGVRWLLEWFGMPRFEEEKRPRGRPAKGYEKTTKLAAG